MRQLLAAAIVICQLGLYAQDSDSLLFKQARDAYFAGDPAKAVELLDSDPTIPEGNQRIAYYLNAGTAHSALGNYNQSNELFDIAYRIIEDSSKNTGSKAIAYLMNPLATQYEGESAEQMLIHYFKIQNYLAARKGAKAQKEVDRLGERIKTVKEIYKEENVFTGETMYYQLAGIVAEYNGNNAAALEAYLKAHELYGSHNLPTFDVEAPWQLKADIVRLSEGSEKDTWASLFDINPAMIQEKDNEVLVFWHNGRSPNKNNNLLDLNITAQGMDVKALDSKTGETFPVAMAAGMQAASKVLAGGTNVKLKFARYQKYEPEYSTAVIGTVSMDPMENLTEVLDQSLFDRKSRDINSMMGRHLAKSVLKNKAKEKASGLVNRIPGASLVGANKLVNKAIDKAVDNTEKADWRQWDMLPHSISYGRLYLPEGPQSVTVIYLTPEGKSEVKVEAIEVKKGTNVHVLTTFGANEIEEPETPNYAAGGTALMGLAGTGTTAGITPMALTAPSKYPSGETKAMYTEFAGSKLDEGQYSVIVGNPDEVLQSGTVTLNFERNRAFAGSAAGAMVVINGKDKTKIKNGDSDSIQIEANGGPILLTVRNALIKEGKNNPLEKRVKILYYPTRLEEDFYINFGALKIYEIMTHKSLVD